MSVYSGILFDKDGTLFDFAATWQDWARAFLDRLCLGDKGAAIALGSKIGFNYEAHRFVAGSVVVAGTPSEIASIVAQHVTGWNAASLLELINEEAAKAQQQPAVPLAPLLEGLRDAGYALGVATNDAIVPARAHLAQAKIVDHFDFIAGFDSGYGGKPAPGQMRAFCDCTGLAPDQCVMVGDSVHDLAAGRAAGMACVGVLTGLADRAELAPHADAVLPDIGALPGWLTSATR